MELQDAAPTWLTALASEHVAWWSKNAHTCSTPSQSSWERAHSRNGRQTRQLVYPHAVCCGLLDSVRAVNRVGYRSNEALVSGRSCIVDVVVAKSRSNVKFKHPRLYMSLQATNRTSSVSLRLPKRASRGKKRVDFGFVTPCYPAETRRDVPNLEYSCATCAFEFDFGG